jgi:signal transduction histidine kinase
MAERPDTPSPTAQPPVLELCRRALDRSLDAVTILQSVRDATGAIVDFTWVYANQEAAAALRRPVAELVGANLLDVLPGNRAGGLFERYVQVVETGVSRDDEIAYEADGLSGWFRNMAVRLGDGVAVFFREVTAEKRTAELLRVSEERRRLAVEAAGLGDWYVSVASRAPELSRQCKLHLGLPPDAAPALPDVIACLHPEDRVAAGLKLERALAAGAPLAATPRVLWPDGSLRWVSVLGRAMPGRPGELVGVTVDVTEQVWAERAQRLLAEAGAVLAETRDYEQTLARVNRLAIPELADFSILYLIGPDGAIQRSAQAHRDPEGEAALRELERRYPLDVSRGSPVGLVLRGDLPLARVQLSVAARAAMARDAGHLALFEALGTRGYLAVPLVSGGERLGAMLVATTTPGRAYGQPEEELLTVLAERVAAAIVSARLYEAERAARAAAELAARQRDDLLAYMAHDLKNPLTAILGAAQMLQRRLQNPAAPDVERLRRGLAVVESAAASLAAQLNEIQDVARLQAGQPLELQRRPVELVELVRRAAAVRQAATDRHQIEVVAADPQLWCECDPFRIERVATNLLSNAVKYSPGGVVTVRLGRERDGAAVWAVLEVCDEGVGIAAEDQPFVFERFYRGANVAGVGGSGLGLASVAAVVAQHGGQVGLASAPGRGTTVTVRLPAAEG